MDRSTICRPAIKWGGDKIFNQLPQLGSSWPTQIIIDLLVVDRDDVSWPILSSYFDALII